MDSGFSMKNHGDKIDLLLFSLNEKICEEIFAISKPISSFQVLDKTVDASDAAFIAHQMTVEKIFFPTMNQVLDAKSLLQCSFPTSHLEVNFRDLAIN